MLFPLSPWQWFRYIFFFVPSEEEEKKKNLLIGWHTDACNSPLPFGGSVLLRRCLVCGQLVCFAGYPQQDKMSSQASSVSLFVWKSLVVVL